MIHFNDELRSDKRRECTIGFRSLKLPCRETCDDGLMISGLERAAFKGALNRKLAAAAKLYRLADPEQSLCD
jgi:hypothetical protein